MAEILFPAQAGVIPDKSVRTIPMPPVPRASGGDPFDEAGEGLKNTCSPRKRG